MKLKDEKAWKKWEESNQDSYGKCCIDVARRVMEILDKGEPFDAQEIVSQANKELDTGITWFQAGCVASMVSRCHSRGEDFRCQWNNHYQLKDEGDKANETKGVLNPALLSISVPE